MSTQEKETASFEEMLDRNGYLAYTNVGVSMMPLLRQGKDVMEIRKKGPERCKKYDAVLYKVNDRFLLLLCVLSNSRETYTKINEIEVNDNSGNRFWAENDLDSDLR